VLLKHHLQHHRLATSVGTGMDFQQGMPSTNKYYILKQALKKKFKMVLAHKNTNPFTRMSHLFESLNAKPIIQAMQALPGSFTKIYYKAERFKAIEKSG
jgi:hypothetical protein